MEKYRNTNKLVKYSLNLYKFSVFKSIWSEYDLKVINRIIIF